MVLLAGDTVHFADRLPEVGRRDHLNLLFVLHWLNNISSKSFEVCKFICNLLH